MAWRNKKNIHVLYKINEAGISSQVFVQRTNLKNRLYGTTFKSAKQKLCKHFRLPILLKYFPK